MPKAEGWPSEPRFEIRSRLGAGGMGVVYEALDRERGSHVALKRLVRAGPAEVHQLKREFRALADIVHPNLVRLHELISSPDGEPFFTMELVPGVDFLSYVRNAPRGDEATVSISRVLEVERGLGPDGPEGPVSAALALGDDTRTGELSLPRLRRALAQLALGLVAIHRAGKIHRDLKPTNVMVRHDGRLVILDFGLVRDSRESPFDEVPGEAVIGTPAYMSPEHVAGARLTPASDWYSVGVMLYEALTGKCPFDGPVIDLLRRKLGEDVRPPSELAPDLPEDLTTLCVRLLERRPERRPTEAEIFRALSIPGERERERDVPLLGEATAFVGRELECEALQEAALAARDGRPVAVYLEGRSGMGKSALADRLLEGLRKDPSTLVLRGRCYERETVPYKAVDGLVDALAHHLATLPRSEVERLVPPDGAALARVFPALLRVRAVAEAAAHAPVVRDEQELRWRGFAALKGLLAALGAERTLVLAIDDLQWGDTDGAKVIIELLRPPEAPRMLLLATFRSEEAERSACVGALLAECLSPGFRGDVRRVRVEPLSRVEAFELALTLLGDAGVPEADLDGMAGEVAQESEGSPFFVWELVHAAVRGDRAEVSLSKLLEERVSSLPDEARRLLEVVAIAGSPVAQELLARVAHTTEPRDVLALLRSRRLVRARGLSDTDAVEAYHDRVRETVLGSLDPTRRRELHRELVTALEDRGSADPEQLAEHWQLAGELERAAALAEIAGDRAARALAFDRAARLYALALERQRLDEETRRKIEQRRGDALANAGRGAEAAEAYLRAAARTRPEEPELGLELQRRAAEQLLSSGHIDDGLGVLDGVLRALGLWLPSSPRLALGSLLVRRAELRVRGTRFRERAPSEISDEARLRIDACWALTVGLNGVDMVRGADFGARSLLLALRAGDPYRIGRALAFETTTNAFIGSANRARAERFADELTSLAERMQNAHLRGFALLVKGMCAAFAAGHWTRALGWYAKAERVFREECSGVSWEVATTDMVTAWSLFYTGRIKELGARLPATLNAAEQRRDLYAQANLTTSATWVMLADDDVDGARAYPVSVMARWSRKAFHLQHYAALLSATHVDRYAGLGAAAYARFESAFPALEASMLLRAQANRIVARYERGLSAVAAAEEHGPHTTRRSALLEAAERDAAALAGEGVAWAEPYALLIRAAGRALRGDAEGAAGQLVRAECAFDACDMHLYAASARRHRGVLTGGDAGRGLVASADGAMLAEEIVAPARWAGMLAPGFGG